MGKYIYCIIKENKERSFGSIGIDNREVHLVHYKDIAAVVSDTPIINFDRLDKEELTKYIAIHQKVNEAVMSTKSRNTAGSGGKDYDVVPMAFGIIAPSVDEVLPILERVYLQFKTGLEKVAGKAEFVVQVWWNQAKLIEELININPKIQKLKKKVSLKPGIQGIPFKLKLGRLIHQGLETYRQVYIKDIQTFLSSCPDDSTSNQLLENDMLANFSFLIERDGESGLDRKMIELGKKYEGKLRFKYIGPMPPYSFVNINLSIGNFKLINEARKLLGLGQEATLDEIKKAYYALVHQYHPDKHQNNPAKEAQMKKIAEAHSILENYCQSWDEFMNKPEDSRTRTPQSTTSWLRGKSSVRDRQKYSFKEEDVKNSIMIK